MDSRKKELEMLRKLINKQARRPTEQDMLFGIYQYWAELGAIKNLLLKKKIISRKELSSEMLPIVTWMKRDFKER